jgi:hypothetical protein
MSGSQTLPLLCECDSFECSSAVQVPQETVQRVMQDGLIPIIDGCKIGPKPTDELVEECVGYKLYRED